MALVAGEPYRSVANRYESLSQASVQRHSENHLPATLAQAKEAEMVAHADDLLEQVRDLQVRTFAILEAAEASEQHRTALSAIREARGRVAGAQGSDSRSVRTLHRRTRSRPEGHRRCG